MHLLLASLTWDPGFRGILSVAVAVAVLCGTVLILLITNNGPRLGFHLAVTALFGWLTLMFFFWVVFAIGYHGPAPTWKVIDVSTDAPNAFHSVLHDVPQPTSLPSPDQYVTSNEKVAKAFEGSTKEPTWGDVLAADPEIANDLKAKLNGWRLVATSNPVSGDAGATATSYLVSEGIDGNGLSSAGFELGNIYDRGGKPLRTDDSVFGRVTNRIQKLGMWFVADNPAHYAVVQARLTVPQVTLAGQAPPSPVVDPDQPVINILMVRDLGAVRLPGTAGLFFSGTVFAILAYQLHRRDKIGMANRAAAAGAGPKGA
jgi:hypothetical protein